jgi:hypothetical protein
MGNLRLYFVLGYHTDRPCRAKQRAEAATDAVSWACKPGQSAGHFQAFRGAAVHT